MTDIATPGTKLTSDNLDAAYVNTNIQGAIAEFNSRKPQGYQEFVGNVPTATTVEASATVIVTAPSVSANGVDRYEVEFFCPSFTLVGNAAGNKVTVCLFDNGTQIGRLAVLERTDAGVDTRRVSVAAKRSIVPSAGAHIYSIRAFHSVAACTAEAGAGGVGILVPGYVKVHKVN